MVMQQNSTYQYNVQAPIPVNRNEQMPPIASIANKINDKSNVKGTITLPPISSIVGNCTATQQPPAMSSPTEMSHYQHAGLNKLGFQPAPQQQQYHYYVPPPRSITPCLSSNNGSPDFSHSNLVAMPLQQQQPVNPNGTVVMDRSLSNYSNSSVNSQVLESTATTPISTPPSAFSSRSASTSSLVMPTVFEGQRTGPMVSVTVPPKTPPASITTKAPKKSKSTTKRSKSHSPTLKSRNDSTNITVSAIDELSKLRKQCPACGKICSRPSTLKTHYLIHTGDTPFKCPWQDCKKAFNVKSNMLRHLKCHEKKKLGKSATCN